ncbi:MAG: hypothetical protein DHS20C08_21080 [Rhodomicrobium sp.]|nr:MAG: hypothetical protein DHS20C08_21080 [Rhodomicrobium sp.]
MHGYSRPTSVTIQEFDDIGNSAIHLLHRAGQCAGDVFSQKVKAAGLTPRQFAILSTVASYEGLNQTDLVSRTGVDRSTLADIIRRMLSKGLIYRVRKLHDARAYAVHLTDKGKEVLRQVAPAAADADERLLAALPAEQRKTFLDTLHLLVENIHSVGLRY